MIEVSVVKDSISDEGFRLTTLSLRYHRYIHSEILTHRFFSRNASSSRAIPVRKLATQDRVYPIEWRQNIPGMQAGEPMSPEQEAKAKAVWDRMADACLEGVEELAEIGLHKQWANRALEWFTPISVLVSSTTWANFLGLRFHGDAMPEIALVAAKVYGALCQNEPTHIEPDQWHLPYVSEEEARDLGLTRARKCSAARCARVSYLTHEGKVPDVDKDLSTFEKLAGSQPIHASPLEHQATPDRRVDPLSYSSWANKRQHGNFNGWRQYRKMIEGENISNFSFEDGAIVF